MKNNARTAFSCFVILVAITPCMAQRQEGPGSASSLIQVTKAAQDFLDALEPEQRSKALFPFDSGERKDWSNLPYPLHQREGIRFGEMSPEARTKAHQLFQAVLSSQGYLKVSGIMHLDDLLMSLTSYQTEDGRNGFGSDFYWMGVFGTPAPDSVWGWQLDGHHLALNFTITVDEISVNPAFLGTDPAEVRTREYSGWRILGEEDDLGLQLISALNTEQQARAILADTASNAIFTGPGRGDALKEYQGIPASDMTPDQRRLLLQLIGEYIHNLNDDLAHAQMERLSQAGIENVYFAWMGPVHPGPRDRYYYRIHGNTLLIE
ncbi:MAG: DUF3500 domain-containing protein, partial [Gammaproteobacteria bacterium]